MLDVAISSFGPFADLQASAIDGRLPGTQADALGWLVFCLAVVTCIVLIPSIFGTARPVTYFLVLATFAFSTYLLVSTNNLIIFLFLWEFTSLSAWGVGKLGIRGSNPALGALPVNAVGSISSLAMFAFVALLVVQSGSFEMGALKTPSASLLMALLLLAIILKVFGLLSTAWMEGNGKAFPVSNALLAGGAVTVVGIYPFLRFAPELIAASHDAQVLAMWVSLPLGLIFSLAALREEDLYRLASLLTFGQFCLALAGFSWLTREHAASFLFALVTYNLAALVLFLTVGLVAEWFEARRLGEVGGLAGRQPGLAFVVVLATLAGVGLPPFGSFVGRLTTSLAMLGQADVPVAIVWVASWVAITLALFRVAAVALFPPITHPGDNGRLHLFSLVPISIVVALLVFAALWPGEISSLLEPVASRIVG